MLEKVKAEASGIHAFIVQKDLVTLSDRDNMRIVPTPVFLRGYIPSLDFIRACARAYGGGGILGYPY